MADGVRQRYKLVFGIFAWLALGAAIAAIVARSLVAGRLWNVRYDWFYAREAGNGYAPVDLVLGCYALGALALVAAIVAIAVRPRGWYVLTVLGAAVAAVAWFGASTQQSDLDIRRVIGAGNHLVSAIERYKNDNGEYPAGLAELVPAYLPTIPKTGLTSQRQFYYMRRGSSENGWSLEASLTKSLMGDEPFVVTVMLIPRGTIVYRPSGNYTDIEVTEALCGWAFTTRD